MDQCAEGRQALANEFSECRKAIIALGDETRQSIIMALLQNEKIGLRVGEITEKRICHGLRFLIICRS